METSYKQREASEDRLIADFEALQKKWLAEEAALTKKGVIQGTTGSALTTVTKAQTKAIPKHKQSTKPQIKTKTKAQTKTTSRAKTQSKQPVLAISSIARGITTPKTAVTVPNKVSAKKQVQPLVTIPRTTGSKTTTRTVQPKKATVTKAKTKPSKPRKPVTKAKAKERPIETPVVKLGSLSGTKKSRRIAKKRKTASKSKVQRNRLATLRSLVG